MSSEPILALVRDPGPAEPGADAAPQVFLRILALPPGAPWDQARAAELEARNGAPLALELVSLSVRRLSPWRPGRPGRFALAYVRADALAGEAPADGPGSVEAGAGELAVEREVEGRRLVFRFEAAGARERRRRRRLLLLAGGGLALALSVLALSGAGQARVRREAELSALETRAGQLEGEARATATRRRDAALLDRNGLRGHDATSFLEDLAWASRARAPAARVSAVHWRNGVLSVDAAGDKSPFVATDRAVSATPAPRAGRTTWTVDRAAR